MHNTILNSVKKSVGIILVTFVTSSVFGQLSLQGGFTAQQLAEQLAGNNITITNASIIGDSVQHGSFNFGGTGFGFNSGIIMTTGDMGDAVGPNVSTSTSTDNGGPGTALLDSLSGQTTYDGVVLQFDFEVQSDYIEFSYIFASEEYNEWVGSAFNDAFAFFISGPGITGEENLAIVPGTTDPITINNINNNSYWQYYHDNTDNNTNIEFDGYTIEMKAQKSGLIPCNTYTLKLMIADGSDGIYDAAVFLKENSLVQRTLSASLATPTVDGTALEGCIKASFTFNLDSASDQDIAVPIEVFGNAVNGVDYAFIDSLFYIPAGQTSASIIVDAFADGLPEGQEEVIIAYQSRPCAPYDTVVLIIEDAQPIEYTTAGTDLICAGDSSGQVTLSVAGGTSPYSITLTDTSTLVTNTYSDTVIPNLNAGTYWVDIEDVYGCAGEDIVSGAIFDAGPIFIPDGKGKFYETTLPISGFNGATLTDPGQLLSVCAVLEHSFMGELEISLIAPGGQVVILKEQPGGATTNLGEPVAKGPVDAVNPDTSAGVGYEYCWTANATFGLITDPAFRETYTYTTTGGVVQSDKYMPSGSYTPYESFTNLIGTPLDGDWKLKVQDKIPNDNGWIFSWSISLNADRPDSIVTILEPELPSFSVANTLPDCGLNNGSIDITPIGGTPPFTYLWSNGPTTQDLSGIGAGTYVLTYTDSTTCSYDTTILLSNNGTLATLVSKTDPTCVNANNGAIDLTITGGTSPYLTSWNTGDTTQDLSGLSPGNYIVNITDGAGCIGVQNVSINQAVPMLVSGVVTNETCGDENGAINLSVAGGTGVYTYSWSNGATSEDVTFLQAGTFFVDVTDSNGCVASDTFKLVNLVGNCIPVCDIATTFETVTNETCGNGLGAISLTISGGTQPYVLLWSDGFTGEDRTGLSAGSYTLNVTDVNSCTFQKTFIVSNNTGTLALVGGATDEICGNTMGSVDISVSGGAMPYLFTWNTGATTEDLTNLSSGNYSVSVRDANNCVINGSYTVTNLTGSMAQTYGSVFDEVCGDTSGSIDITISGGANPLSYLWSNGAITQDLKNLSAGTYSCTVTDNSGCKLNTPVYTVNNQSSGLKVFDIDIADEICSNGNGRINVDIINGTLPYSYQWTTLDTTQVIDSLSAGNYACTITDAGGCSVQTGNIIVLNSSGTLMLESVVATNELCGNSLGSVDISVSGGAPPYVFAWNTGASTEDITNLPAGSYSVTITDTNGCTLNASTTVNNAQGTLALMNQVITNETCGDSSGAINLTIGGGSLPYIFSWDNGPVTEDQTGLKAGIYNCNISDAQGCLITTSATVNNITGTLNLVSTAVTNEVCGNAGGAINITVAGGTLPYTFSWSNGASTEDLSGLSAGTYSCTITDGAGCIVNVAPVTINNSAPGLLIGLDSLKNETCGDAGGEIYVSVTGGVLPLIYSWSSGPTIQDITGLTAGNYVLTVTDSNGCAASANYDILNNSGAFSIVSKVITNENCGDGNGAINITTTGGVGTITYAWGHGPTTEDVSGLSAGTYTLDITDNNGCALSTGNMIVNNAPGTLSLDNTVTTDEQCNDGSGAVNITISGGTGLITYAWSNGATTEDLSGLNAGIYTCVVSDANGCSLNVNSVVQNDPGTLTVFAETLTGETCYNNNAAADLSVGGGILPYTFAWSNGDTTEDLSNVTGGNYICLITDSAGCQLSHNVSLATVPNDLAIVGNNIFNNICGQSNGAIYLSVVGTGTPVQYAWNSGQTTEDISGLAGGTFDVILTDKNGCQVTDTFVVSNVDTSCVYHMCSTTFTTTGSDTIKDSGGDGNYGNNESCSLIISPPCAESISLSFTELDIAFGDNLVVYDGTSDAGIFLGFYNGTFLPGTVTANSGSMYLEFNSNGFITDTGFTAIWNTVFITDAIFANYNMSNTNPAFGETVLFTDLTVTNPTFWNWDFGDGTFSTQQNPAHQYSTSGTHNVTLITGNCFSSDTITKSITVQGVPTIVYYPGSISENLSCGDSVLVPVTIKNTGAGQLIVNEDNIGSMSTTQVNPYTTSGATSNFTITGIDPSIQSLDLIVTMNGDYDFNFEYANLFIEGAFYTQVADGDVSNGTDIVVTYTLSGPQLATWIADGILQVALVNEFSVNTGVGGTDVHQVQVQIEDNPWFLNQDQNDTINPGDSVIVWVNLNSTNIAQGVYNSSLVLNSNDTLNPYISIPLSLNLTGAPSVATSDTCINFPNSFVGDTLFDTLRIFNNGCDTLVVSSISSSLGEMTGSVPSVTVAPFGWYDLVVTFVPASSGIKSGNITLNTNDVNVNVCLTAEVLVPPVISTLPDTIKLSLNCSDSTSVPLTVYNNGGSDLYYTIFKSDTAASLTDTVVYTLSGETTIHPFTGLPTQLDSLFMSVTLNGDYDQAAETATLYIDGDSIGALNTGLLNTDIVTNLVFTGPQLDTWLADGQIVVSMENSFAVNPFTITDYNIVNISYSTVKWMSLTTAQDTLMVSDSMEYFVALSAAGLGTGIYNSGVTINSNDPLTPQVIVPVILTVTSEPTIEVPAPCLSLPLTYMGSSTTDSIWITNSGCADLVITNIISSNPDFSVGTTALTIPAYSSQYVGVTFIPSDSGNAASTFTIYNNDVDTVVCVNASGAYAPVIGTNPVTTITGNITVCNGTVVVPLTLYNTGFGNLIFTLSESTPWMTTDITNGVVAAGDSLVVNVTMDGNGYVDGINNSTLSIISNDTTNSVLNINVVMNITANPLIGVQTSCVNIDTTMIGTSNSGTFWIYNTGCSALAVSGIVSGNTDFSAAPSSLNVAVGDSALINVLFTPTVSGNISTTLLIQNNDVDTSVCVNAVAIDAPIASYNLDTSAAAINCVGTSVLSLTLFNSGLGNMEYTLSESASWMSLSSTTGTIPTMDSNTVTITLNSASLSAGVYNTSIILNTNDPLYPVDTIGVTLTVTQSEKLALSAACINYGTVGYGTSSSGYVTLYNEGCINLNISNLSSDNGMFTVIGSTSFTILPGDSAQVQVDFSPTTNGVVSGNLMIQNSDQDTSVCLTATGNNVPLVTLASDTIYAFVDDCNNLTTGTLGLYNSGQGNLTYTVGASGAAWLTYSAVTGSLVAGDSLILALNLDASGLPQGIYQTTIATATNDPNNTSVSTVVILNVNRIPFIDPQTLCVNFDSVLVGDTVSRTYWVRNTGCDTLFVNNVISTSPAVVPGLTSYYVLPGDSMNLTLTLLPTVSGLINESITLSNNDRDTVICVTGTVLDAPLAGYTIDNDTAWINCTGTTVFNLNLFNSGLGTMIYSVADSSSWISLSGTGGSIASMDSNLILVTLNSTGLSAGVYNSIIQVNTNDPQNPLFNIPITLYVTEREQLELSATCINFGSVSFGSTGNGFVTLRNTGCANLNVSNISSDNLNFTVVSSTSFNIAPGDSVQVQVDLNPLTNGFISGNLLVENSDLDTVICLTGSGINVPVAALQSDSVGFDVDDCNNLRSGQVVLGNSGQGVLNYSLGASPVTWLTYTSGSGTLNSGDSLLLPVNIDATLLSEGTHTTTIDVTTNDPNNPVISVVVEVNITRLPVIAPQGICVDFGTVSVGGTYGSTMQVVNTGCDVLSISGIISSEPMVSAGITILNIMPGDTAMIPVTFAPGTIGTVNGTFTLLNNDVDTVICFTGTAAGNAGYSSPTAALDFTIDNCTQTMAVDGITIQNTGTLNLTVNIDSNNLPGWMTLSSYSQVVSPANSSVILVTVQRGSLASGINSWNIAVLTNDTNNPMVIIPVTFEIQDNVCGDFTFIADTCSGTVTFSDLSSNAPVSWMWDFGDGGTSSDQNPTYTYPAAGNYDITLIVCNASDCDTIVQSVSVNGVTANFILKADTVDTGESVSLQDASTNAASWNWNFGNGQTSTDQNPSTSYDFGGTYTITLDVTGANGCTDQYTHSIFVIAKEVGIADLNELELTISPNPYNVRTTIHFTLAKQSNVSLNVYNALGDHVATLCEEQLQPQSYNYTFSALEHGAADGIYYLRLSVDGVVQTYKIVETK